MKGRDDRVSVGTGTVRNSGNSSPNAHSDKTGAGGTNDGIYGGDIYPGVLPAVPADGVPVIPNKDRRTDAATAASAAGVRALSAQALQFYFRAPVKAFFRTRVDYLAYARGANGGFAASGAGSSSRLWAWLSGTTPGVLTLAIKRHGWSVVPDQVMPPLMANIGVAAVLYTSYLQILARLHPESGQARKRVYPPPAPMETFVAGFLAGSIQSLVAAPLDAIQARYDHRDVAADAVGNGNGKGKGNGKGAPRSMWAFSAAKLREIGLRGIFAGWGLSFVKDSFGNGVFFSVFEYVKAQSYYSFVAYYYGALDGSKIMEQQMRNQTAERRKQQRQQWVQGQVSGLEARVESAKHTLHGDKAHNTDQEHTPHQHPPIPLVPKAWAEARARERAEKEAAMPLVIRPHYALEPTFLLLAGVSASFAQQVLLHPLTHFQVVHWDMLEDLDAAVKADREAAAARAAASKFATTTNGNGGAAGGDGSGNGSANTNGLRNRLGRVFRLPGFHFMRTYYHAYLQTLSTCTDMAAAEGRSLMSWLYRGFWWNTIRQVPSTSAGLIIFELLRRKYGMSGEEVRISQDGYDILLR
ncbi:mitochondrial carrier protein [Sporothrix schenckii 1099-18]|uniref:Mitochondrial carrier protein n=1 Tax=Sporothrix schenckii 1099-18 TaxID=1397361 RepID=A0A0F2MIC2_SPOSC|nr:mitochondrial carrier protein [Sporothrix schenckii 1099-18]KJR88585.1 mitochondrial carrier protein [Sporothrix schenckii 1099-18]